jgi:hypothetical protein
MNELIEGNLCASGQLGKRVKLDHPTLTGTALIHQLLINMIKYSRIFAFLPILPWIILYSTYFFGISTTVDFIFNLMIVGFFSFFISIILLIYFWFKKKKVDLLSIYFLVFNLILWVFVFKIDPGGFLSNFIFD